MSIGWNDQTLQSACLSDEIENIIPSHCLTCFCSQGNVEMSKRVQPQSMSSPVSPSKQPHESMNAFELMASALDISSILEKRLDSALRKFHWTTRKVPSEIWYAIEEAVSCEGGTLREEDFPWRLVPSSCTTFVSFSTLRQHRLFYSARCRQAWILYYLFSTSLPPVIAKVKIWT